MNKLVTLLGLVVASLVIFRFHTGQYNLNDAFKVIDLKNEVENSEGNGKSEKDEDDGDGSIYGAMINPKLGDKALKKILAEILNDSYWGTVVVVAENPSLRGASDISAISSFEGEQFGDISIDQNLLSELTSGDDLEIGVFKRVFKEGATIKKALSLIRETSPQKKSLPILLKDSADKDDLTALSEKLSKHDNLIIISLSTFNDVPLHNELKREVLNNFDPEGVLQLDVSSRPSIYVLMNYLKNVGAKKMQMYGDDSSEGIFTFHEGESNESDRDLTILAFGDIMLGRYVRVLMDLYGADYIFENIKGVEGQFFKCSDIVFGNLEGPIKGQGSKGGKSLVFSFNEDIVGFLKRHGFNLVSIANNHAMDQGASGRDSTVSALDNGGLSWCGHPSEVDEGSVYYGNVLDKKYAFVCFQDVTSKLDDAAAVQMISDIRSNVDYLIVSVHWGYEYKHNADFKTQIEPGKAFIDAGADFVIGHHPHVVQNFEVYKGKVIFYSLGNFVFDQYWSKDTQEELAIGIVLDDKDDYEDNLRTKIYLFPMRSERSQSRLLNSGEYSKWIEKFISYGNYPENLKEQIRNGVIEINSEF
ncbi:MAG: CapA family protein [Patescibacteria group bacterium]